LFAFLKSCGSPKQSCSRQTSFAANGQGITLRPRGFSPESGFALWHFSAKSRPHAGNASRRLKKVQGIMDKEKKNPPASSLEFFGLTFFLTWMCWIPAGLLSKEHSSVANILHYIGGAMPTLSALLLLYLHNRDKERKDYWQRLVDFRHIRKSSWCVILLTVPVLTISGIVGDIILGGTGAKLEFASKIFSNPFALLPFAIFTFVFGPLPEEMAWRGYALDGLQIKWNALIASLILGAAWTIWHFPLFWIEGSYQYGLGVGTSQFWLYMLDKIPQSILMTWLYNNSQRSTVTAILFHFMVNFVGELFNLTLRAEAFYIASWWVAAVLVVISWKTQRVLSAKSAPRR
jgi:membrane protease YdiL (CAAX protease family)